MTPRTINNERQNHPELIVQDAVKDLGLNPFQAQRLRWILLRRGVNKWLYARWLLIQFKHKVKEQLKLEKPKTPMHRMLQWVLTELQHIAKLPRWVEWGPHIHRKMKNNIHEVQIRREV